MQPQLGAVQIAEPTPAMTRRGLLAAGGVAGLALLSSCRRATPLTWTAPADDIDVYNVRYLVSGSAVVINLQTTETSATVPALPSAYDRDVSFPFAGGPGTVRVIANRGEFPEDVAEAGDLLDAESATGPAIDITF